MDKNSLFFVRNGNLVEINLVNGQSQTFNFTGAICQIIVVEGRSVYYKDHDEFTYFVDLDYVFT